MTEVWRQVPGSNVPSRKQGIEHRGLAIDVVTSGKRQLLRNLSLPEQLETAVQAKPRDG